MKHAHDCYKHFENDGALVMHPSRGRQRGEKFASHREIVATYREANKHREGMDNPLFEVTTPTPAHVSDDRWMVDCVCGTGLIISLTEAGDGEEAACFVCGAVWINIVFPEFREELEYQLMLRKVPRQRNWRFGESLQAIKNENDENPQFLREDPNPRNMRIR